mmetsp:Transcript_13966/g.22822  ORF Transcript_13966/g.22822 Transcript_13966/m.22822 type:complete len:166 (-) Transcript_13966:26-523(-)
MSGRKLFGNVISTAMNKSAVVNVRRTFPHPIYGKMIHKDKRYIVHDENEVVQKGDHVEILSCRPLSRHKSYYISKVTRPVNGGDPFALEPLKPLVKKAKEEKAPKLGRRARVTAKKRAAKAEKDAAARERGAENATRYQTFMNEMEEKAKKDELLTPATLPTYKK